MVLGNFLFCPEVIAIGQSQGDKTREVGFRGLQLDIGVMLKVRCGPRCYNFGFRVPGSG